MLYNSVTICIDIIPVTKIRLQSNFIDKTNFLTATTFFPFGSTTALEPLISVASINGYCKTPFIV